MKTLSGRFEKIEGGRQVGGRRERGLERGVERCRERSRVESRVRSRERGS